jgi:hypothetical protein
MLMFAMRRPRPIDDTPVASHPTRVQPIAQRPIAPSVYGKVDKHWRRLKRAKQRARESLDLSRPVQNHSLVATTEQLSRGAKVQHLANTSNHGAAADVREPTASSESAEEAEEGWMRRRFGSTKFITARWGCDGSLLRRHSLSFDNGVAPCAAFTS